MNTRNRRGRAGRRGIDTIGANMAFTKFDSKKQPTYLLIRL